MNKKTENILVWALVGVSILAVSVLVYKALRKKPTPQKLKHPNPQKILIVGDSQSAVQSQSGSAITYTYPNLLRKQFPDKFFDVSAVGGKTTKYMLDNLPSKLANTKYDRVYIYGGGNDTSNASIPLNTTLANIQKMVDLSAQNGADVFVNLGYKVEGDFGNYKIMPMTPYITDRTQWIPFVEKRKELQRLIPLTIKNANFIQPYSLNSLTSDGIHPTAEGHKLVAVEFSKTLNTNQA